MVNLENLGLNDAYLEAFSETLPFRETMFSLSLKGNDISTKNGMTIL
jgi:hypothetical protein